MTKVKNELSFDLTASDYSKYRPGYPEEMFKDIIKITGISSESNILDIGSGTGQAAIPLLEKGYSVTCLEPGKNLISLLKKNTEQFEKFNCVNSTFEEWRCVKQLDLIIAGTSFHWLDLKLSLPKIEKILKPSGNLCLFWNMHPRPFTGFFVDVQEIYKNIFPVTDKKSNWKDLSSKKDDVIQIIKNNNLFDMEFQESYKWSVTLKSDEYLRLLNTFSDNIILTAKKREKLFSEIKKLIDSGYKGKVERPYYTELYIFKPLNKNLRSGKF